MIPSEINSRSKPKTLHNTKSKGREQANQTLEFGSRIHPQDFLRNHKLKKTKIGQEKFLDITTSYAGDHIDR